MKHVIGLDLSITATGIATADGHTYTVGGKAALGDRRIVTIADAVNNEIRWDTDLVVIEDLVSHGPGGGMAAAQVMGAIKCLLAGKGIPYALCPPSSLKKFATGRGNASKADLAVALYKRCGLELGDDNQVDAKWLALLGHDLLGDPQIDLPAHNRTALTGVHRAGSAARTATEGTP